MQPEPPEPARQCEIRREPVQFQDCGPVTYVFVPHPDKAVRVEWAYALIREPGIVLDQYGNRISA